MFLSFCAGVAVGVIVGAVGLLFCMKDAAPDRGDSLFSDQRWFREISIAAGCASRRVLILDEAFKEAKRLIDIMGKEILSSKAMDRESFRRIEAELDVWIETVGTTERRIRESYDSEKAQLRNARL